MVSISYLTASELVYLTRTNPWLLVLLRLVPLDLLLARRVYLYSWLGQAAYDGALPRHTGGEGGLSQHGCGRVCARERAHT